MRSSRVALMTVRATGLLLILLGALFWAGRARALIPVHMLLGLILVLALWVLGVQAARAGAGMGFVLFTAAWGLAEGLAGRIRVARSAASA